MLKAGREREPCQSESSQWRVPQGYPNAPWARYLRGKVKFEEVCVLYADSDSLHLAGMASSSSASQSKASQSNPAPPGASSAAAALLRGLPVRNSTHFSNCKPDSAHSKVRRSTGPHASSPTAESTASASRSVGIRGCDLSRHARPDRGTSRPRCDAGTGALAQRSALHQLSSLALLPSVIHTEKTNILLRRFHQLAEEKVRPFPHTRALPSPLLRTAPASEAIPPRLLVSQRERQKRSAPESASRHGAKQPRPADSDAHASHG